MDSVEAISSVDGRYRRVTAPLADYFSEKALIKNRIIVEGEYLIFLSEHPEIDLRELSGTEKDNIRSLYNLSTDDAKIVKAIENKGYKNIKKTNHDVKSVEYYLKDKFENTSLEDVSEWIHFALTSEDTTNLAYGLMLTGGIETIILPKAEELYASVEGFAQMYKAVPMLARTHGQPASPTTVGKEFKVFSNRMRRQLDQLRNYKILVKLNGASGNYDAHKAAYKNVDWVTFTKDFVERLNGNRNIRMEPNLVTTQIELHDTYAELFNNLGRLNTVVINFDTDLWRYISDEWIIQIPQEGEVGSSTMPHKVNPIDFENSEGNLGLANALFEFFARELPKPRLQRHLTDSTIERAFGTALAHGLIGYNSALKGLSKIAVNEQKVIEELESHPEVISEAIQTILRREGAEMPYEQLKELTRGKKVTLDELRKFIGGLKISDDVREELMQLEPTNYTGLAAYIVETQ
jgi:adenylosuccinate lyase